MRGMLLTKESDSSFAEAHKGILCEPPLMEDEDEDEDQEDEGEDMRETVKSAKWRVEEESKRTTTQAHETWMT